jgi:tetratricopeptide (TPR) repeat protein
MKNNSEMDARSWYNKGQKLALSRKYSEAVKAFDKAIEEDITFADAYYERGLCYHKLGDYHREIDDINTAAKHGNVSAQIYTSQHLKCPKCGYIKEDDVRKCKVCGYNFPKKPKTSIQNKTKKKIIVSLTVIVLIIAGLLVGDFLDKKIYIKAYQSLIKIEGFLELRPFLKDGKNDFKNYNISLTNTLQQIKLLKGNTKRSKQLKKIYYYYVDANEIWKLENKKKKASYTKESCWKNASKMLREYEKTKKSLFIFISDGFDIFQEKIKSL